MQACDYFVDELRLKAACSALGRLLFPPSAGHTGVAVAVDEDTDEGTLSKQARLAGQPQVSSSVACSSSMPPDQARFIFRHAAVTVWSALTSL